jgi:hypothetical protein
MLTPEQIRESMMKAQRDSARQALLESPTVASENEAEDFYRMCREYPGLIEKAAVRIPTRITNGLNPKLAICATVWAKAGGHWDPLIDDQGGFIERQRAKMCYDFVTDPELKEFEYLIMIDDDMEPRLDLLHRLMRWNEPVVGARCVSMHPDFGPMLCYTVKDELGLHRFPTMKPLLKRNLRMPSSGITEVGHIGTGALCIRRDVVESFTWDMEHDKILSFLNEPRVGGVTREHLHELHRLMAPDVPFMVPDALRKEGFRHGELRCGEDIWFCVQVRKKGFHIYVDNSSDVGHRKSMCLALDSVFNDPGKDPKSCVIPAEGPVSTVE